MSASVLYRHPWLYRVAMRFLYGREAEARVNRVCARLGPPDGVVLELCFGDLQIAEHCRRQGLGWIGIDRSLAFVQRARRRGFDARCRDVRDSDALPHCHTCVMMGSLYQFHEDLSALFRRMAACSDRLVLSEPVRNWTHGPWPLRMLAAWLSRTDTRSERFRYDATTLPRALQALQGELGFAYRVLHTARDMLVEVRWSK